MAETRHRTIVEVDVDEARARQKLAGLLQLQNQLNQAFGGTQGTGTPGAGGATNATPGGGAPATPSAPLALPGGGSSAPGGGAPGGAHNMPPAALPTTAITAIPGAPSWQATPGGTERFQPNAMLSGATSATQRALGAGPAAGLALVGAGATGLGNYATRIANDPNAGEFRRNMAGVVSNSMIPGAAAVGALMVGLAFRTQVAQRRAGLDEQMKLAGLTGSGVGYGDAAALGYTPEEAASAAVAFSSGAGFGGNKDASRNAGAVPLSLMRSGTSVGALAAYRGQMAAGAGGMGDANMRTAVALAQSSGLRGSKVDEYLQAIAANTGTMATQGIRTNIPVVEDFLRRAAVTPGLAGSGMGQVRAANALTGSAASARQQALSPFSGMMQSMMFGYAASRASGPIGTAELLSQMAGNPGMAREALLSMGLPAEAVQGMLMQAGLTGGEAMGVQTMNMSGEAPGVAKVKTARAGSLKVASAEREAALVSMISPKKDAEIFKAQGAVDEAMMAIGAGGRDTAVAIVKGISSVVAAVQGLSGLMSDLIGLVGETNRAIQKAAGQ